MRVPIVRGTHRPMGKSCEQAFDAHCAGNGFLCPRSISAIGDFRRPGIAMRFKIIGSAAGGGFPQWNCNFRLSKAVRAGQVGVARQTQSSLAASSDGLGWVLFNASPDINQQIAQTPELQPAAAAPLRSTPIRAVVLTNADVDHIAGLLSLTRAPFPSTAVAVAQAVLAICNIPGP